MTLNPRGKWLTTELPEIVFEDTSVGRLKKRLWDAPIEEIDRRIWNSCTVRSGYGRHLHPEYASFQSCGNEEKKRCGDRADRLHGESWNARQQRFGYLHGFTDL